MSAIDGFDSESTYTFCIDGGASKTLLEILDEKGCLVPITKEGKLLQSVEAGSSNINVVKKEGVEKALQDLFNGIFIGEIPVKEVLPYSKVVAGMAGVSIPTNLATVTSIFEELGVNKNALEILTDAELALRLLHGNGIILIAGTGSICFAEKQGMRQRVGGFGRILGDEGSGYQIGLQAVRAGLEAEYGYGEKTALTPALKSLFGVEELKTLFPQINSLEMSAATIATASALVFDLAAKQDPVAERIVSQAAEDLRKLVSTAIKASQLADCELHLWGGVFKGKHADLIIEKIREETDPKGITIINQSSENAAVIFARTFQTIVKS